MKRLICSAMLLALVANHAVAAPPALPPGLTGAWFNLEQPGHGIAVEVLSDSDALVFWYTFDADGNPYTLYLEARIDGHSLSGNALAPSGPRFGEFDPEDLVLAPWGTISIDFDDCNHGTLRYAATDPAFGSGEFPLLRLTRIQGSQCDLAPPAQLASGVYRASFSGGESVLTARAAVDPDGAVHVVTLSRGSQGLPSQPFAVTNAPEHVGFGSVAAAPDNMRQVSLEARLNTWLLYSDGNGSTATFVLPVDGSGHGTATSATAAPGLRNTVTLDGELPGVELVTALDQFALAGNYAFNTNRGLEQIMLVRIDADGDICIAPTSADPCLFTGTATVTDGGFFDVRIVDALAPTRIYDGRGWLARNLVDGSHELAIAAKNATGGLGVVAERR